MPRYRFGDEVVRRKNLYRPCVMVEAFEKAEAEENDAEIARLFKITAWADNVTAAEWPVVLERFPDEDGLQRERNPVAKSRLKKKAAGWLMALQRIALLNPELFEQIADHAQRTYRDQIQDEPALHLVWSGRLFVSGEPAEVGSPVDWHPKEGSA